jgi:DNA-binding CsgD family transcriptional regulator
MLAETSERRATAAAEAREREQEAINLLAAAVAHRRAVCQQFDPLIAEATAREQEARARLAELMGRKHHSSPKPTKAPPPVDRLPYARLTLSEQEMIWARRARGESYGEIAAALGVERSTVRYALRRMELTGGYASPPGPSQRDDVILAKRAQGMTLAAIGAEFGISRQRVDQVLERAGSATPASPIMEGNENE